MRSSLPAAILLGVVLLGSTAGCEKRRLHSSRIEFRELSSRSLSEEERIIALTRFVERRSDIKTNPYLTQACTTIGRYYARRKRAALAAAWYERAVAAAPDDPSLLNLAGYHYAQQRKSLDRAVEMLSHAVELGLEKDYSQRQVAFFKDSLGWAFRGRGDLRQAITLLTEAHESAPEVTIIEQHLEQVRLELERWETTGKNVDAAFGRSGSSDGKKIDIGGNVEAAIGDRDSPDMEPRSDGLALEAPQLLDESGDGQRRQRLPEVDGAD